MFKKSTFFMRVIIVLLGLAVVVPVGILVVKFAVFLIGAMGHMREWTLSEFYVLELLFGVALISAMIPFFMALYQTMKLLDFIDNKETFSEKSVKALTIIKNCAIAIFALYMVGIMPTACYFVIYTKFSSGIIMWSAFALIPLAIAVFASMLANLIKEAIEIKSENDLTI